MNPAVGGDALFLHPVDQDGQIDGTINNLVHTPNGIAGSFVVGLHEPLLTERGCLLKGKKRVARARSCHRTAAVAAAILAAVEDGSLPSGMAPLDAELTAKPARQSAGAGCPAL